MLESLAAWVLNTYIGEYLEDLNTDQLSVGLLQGQLELENVPLKRSALRKLDVPLSVKSGVLGKLRLSIPLTAFRSEPWRVTISDLFVLLEPSESVYDVEVDEEAEKGRKRVQLDALELFHKRQLLAQLELDTNGLDAADGGGGGWLTVGASLVSNIVENIQLVLTNVHIRYEDASSLPGTTLAAGLTVSRVSVESTSKTWKRGFRERKDGENLYKVLALDAASLYWDSGAPISQTPDTLRELSDLLRRAAEASHSFVLSPVSAAVRMERNSSKFPLKSRPLQPRFRIEVEPGQSGVEIELSQRQLREMRLLSREWARYDRARQHRKWRPGSQVKGHEAAWWRFAGEVELARIRRQRERESWAFASSRARQIAAYAAAYRRRLRTAIEAAEDAARLKAAAAQTGEDDADRQATPNPAKAASDSDTVLLKQIERDPDYAYQQLHVLRDLVFRRLMREAGFVVDDAQPRDKEAPPSEGWVDVQGLSPSPSFHTPSTESPSMEFVDASDSPVRGPGAGGPEVAGGSGLYGWISSWWGAGGQASATDEEEEEGGMSSELDRVLAAERPQLTPQLKASEALLEEGILDVLNESLDDSTLLRRDSLLARIFLKVSRAGVTLVEESAKCPGQEDSAGRTRVLAGHLSGVMGCLELSPRHNSTRADLRLADFSVCSEELSGKEEKAGSESLIWSSGMQTMFAVGKAASAEASDSAPLLSLSYHRSVAKFVARHSFQASFAPISLMYQAAALEMLHAFFRATLPGGEVLEAAEEAAQSPALVSPDIYTTEVRGELSLPSVVVELRSEMGGRAFACLHLDGITASLNRAEAHLSELSVALASLRLENLDDGSQLLALPRSSQQKDDPTGHKRMPSSSSCPDIPRAAAVGALRPAEHLPQLHAHHPPPSPSKHADNRRSSLTAEDATGSKDARVKMELKFVSSSHPNFVSQFKGVGLEVGVSVVGESWVGLEPETWVLLLDFLGAVQPPGPPPAPDPSQAAVAVSLSLPSVSLGLGRPGAQPSLATASLNSVQASVALSDTGVEVEVRGKAFALKDPAASLFPLWLYQEPDEALTLTLHKPFGVDSALQRPYDMALGLAAEGRLTLVHTQRFLMDLLQYLQGFLGTLDYLTDIKTMAAADRPPEPQPLLGRGSRCKLDLQLGSKGGLDLVVPVNGRCPDFLLLRVTGGVRIANHFAFLSQMGAERRDALESGKGDPLLDVLSVACQRVSLHPGRRSSLSSASPPGLQRKPCLDACALDHEAADLLERPTELVVEVERNLDAALSKAVPDLLITTGLGEERCRVTLDTYKLVRGILDHNLGEPLPPPPPGPERLLSGPSALSAADTFVAFAFQLALKNIQLNCLVREEAGGWASLGEVDFSTASLSFESLSDQTREVDLIVTSGALRDTRFEGLRAEERPNAFPLVLSRRAGKAAAAGERQSLMAEVHFLSGPKMEPKLTVLLSEIRLLGVMDWLDRARDFIGQANDFEPAQQPVSPQPSSARLSGPQLSRTDLPSNYAPGVIEKATLPHQGLSGLGVKVNVRDCEVGVAEALGSPATLGLLAEVTLALHYQHAASGPLLKVDASSLQLSTCQLGRSAETGGPLCDPFPASLEMGPEEKALAQRAFKSQLPGLASLDPTVHNLSLTLQSLTARLTYRDLLMASAVLKGFLDHAGLTTPGLSADSGPKAKAGGPAEEPQYYLSRFGLRANSISLWVLDDFEDTRFPLLSVALSKLSVEQSLTESVTGGGSVVLGVELFNQRVYGWEPVVEPWALDGMAWQLADRTLSLSLSSQQGVLDLNVTKTLVEQVAQFQRRWPEVRERVAEDLKGGWMSPGSDYLPYLLRNETGAELQFATYIKTAAGLGHQKLQWRGAPVGGAPVAFRFPAHLSISIAGAAWPHQVVLKVDGWSEVSPVSVDSVGTYFRLPRRSGESSSLRGTGTRKGRLVVAVTTDQDGRKIITVRSALRFLNACSEPLILRLENLATFAGDSHEMKLPPGQVSYAPLNYAVSKVQLRPANLLSGDFCRPIPWQNLRRIGEVKRHQRSCASPRNRKAPFRLCVRVKREAYPELLGEEQESLAGHSFTLLPPITFLNLLPVEAELEISAAGCGSTKDRLPPAHKATFPTMDPTVALELAVKTERFRMAGGTRIHISPSAEEKTLTLRLEDGHQPPRPLFLSLSYSPGRGGSVQLALSAPFWILNKTGLPLLVCQEATDGEAGGQFEESEAGRDMVPLMFSFVSPDSPQRLRVRLGRETKPGGCWRPRWSRPFHLHPGIHHDKLFLQHSDKARPPVVFNFGAEVRGGAGLFASSHFVVLTPQFQLDNRSRFTLLVAQQEDEEEDERCTKVGPGCCLPWHWPRQDRAQLLCVKRTDLAHWSAGFRLNHLSSFHLNMRDRERNPGFVRVEILLHGSMYYVTLSDADGLPPPIRILNDSEVPVLYRQAGATAAHLKALLRPHAAADYNWDRPAEPDAALELTVYGSRCERYALSVLGAHQPLLYHNFLFITFPASKPPDDPCLSPTSPAQPSEATDLVLDALPNGKVILNKKDGHRETQLWRMRPDGELENVGASGREAPGQASQTSSPRPPMVLDIVGASDANAHLPLMIRALDPRRHATQRWNFTQEGRLVCSVGGCWVQAGEGTLLAGNSAVLGPTLPASRSLPGLPPEQWLARERQKPGSGRLAVTVRHQGPTRLLHISDLALRSDRSDRGDRGDLRPYDPARASQPREEEPRLNLEVALVLTHGIGLSLVSAASEELLYARLTMLNLSLRRTKGTYFLGGYVMEVQADNQVVDAENWPLLYIRAREVGSGEGGGAETTEPAVHLEIQWEPQPSYDSFDAFRVHVRKLHLQMEELLLWKLLEFISEERETETGAATAPSSAATSPVWEDERGRLYERLEEPRIELERPDPSAARRLYFGHLQVSLPRLVLSVLTVPGPQLPPHLAALKRSTGLRLVRFESANVFLKDFSQLFYFQTLDFLLDALQKHFKRELTSQAVRILGTVDFLGNPAGLISDVSGGVKDLVIEGNIAGFVSGLGHGVSSSMAKITGSLADGLGKLTSDHEGTQLRKSVRVAQQSSGSSAVSHLYTGVKGLGIGIVGGATSIVKDPVQGAISSGITGFGIGVGKGVLNLVTRPVQGVLDFATGVSTAAREMVAVEGGSSGQRGQFPGRLRLPRLTRSLAGTLPLYDQRLALAQKLLRDIEQGSQHVLCLSVEVLHMPGTVDQFRALVCTRRVYFVRTSADGESRIQLVVPYAELEAAAVEEAEESAEGRRLWVLKLQSLPSRGPAGGPSRVSRVSTADRDLAFRLCQAILHAKQQHDDQRRCLAGPEDNSFHLLLV